MATNKLWPTFRFVLLSIFMTTIIACSTERNPCLEPIVSKLFVGCYQYNVDEKKYLDTLLPNSNFVSLDIDSAKFWYWGADKISKFAIVLSPLRDTSRWTLQVDSGLSVVDTISFIYEKKLKFYSTGCGYGYTYVLSDLQTTTNNLDSATIIDNNVTTKAGVENVKIFF